MIKLASGVLKIASLDLVHLIYDAESKAGHPSPFGAFSGDLQYINIDKITLSETGEIDIEFHNGDNK